MLDPSELYIVSIVLFRSSCIGISGSAPMTVAPKEGALATLSGPSSCKDPNINLLLTKNMLCALST